MDYPLKIIIILVIGIAVILLWGSAFKNIIDDFGEGLLGTADTSGKKALESVKIGECNSKCTAHCINPDDGFEWIINGESCKEITNQDCSCS